MLKQLLIVGFGGGVGSILRYLSSVVTAKYYMGTFPLATFIVNVLGCLLIGFFAGILTGNFSVHPNLKLLFITGFCGGFTTFSTFAMENLNLLEYNHILTMACYIFFSVLLGMLAVWLGLWLAQMV